jgi:hypothetical protein
LRLLGELDLDLLVQITLDRLITAYLEDPGLRISHDVSFARTTPAQTDPDGFARRNPSAMRRRTPARPSRLTERRSESD